MRSVEVRTVGLRVVRLGPVGHGRIIYLGPLSVGGKDEPLAVQPSRRLQFLLQLFPELRSTTAEVCRQMKSYPVRKRKRVGEALGERWRLLK